MNFLKQVPFMSLPLLAALAIAGPAQAAQPPVGLGTATSYAVLAGSAATNTGPTVVNGDLGVSPGTAVTGFPPGIVNGTMHAADAAAGQAQTDTTTAYNDAAGRTPVVSVSGDLGGQMLAPGVYQASSTLGLTGDVTLDAQGDASAVFIFQVGSALTTASSSRVLLTNGADACNVFWQIGSSATLGTNSTFKGTILALTSITLTTGATLDGRALARNGAVTMDSNTITRGSCASLPAGGTPPAGGGLPGDTTPGGTTRPPTRGGTARLQPPPPRGASDCLEGFRAIVTGRRIASVSFTLDGRSMGTRTSAPFAVNLPSMRGGRHWVRALVRFTDSTRTRRIRFLYRACTVAARAVPRFTG